MFKGGKKMETVIGAVPKATLVQTVDKVRWRLTICRQIMSGGSAAPARRISSRAAHRMALWCNVHLCLVCSGLRLRVVRLFVFSPSSGVNEIQEC